VHEGRIQPRLTTFDAAMVVVSLVIGIGIFRTPALVASRTGDGLLFMLAWVLGGAMSGLGALTYAEIGSRFPHAGGYYKVAAACWHPAIAFMLNAAQVVMQAVGATGVAFIGAEYLLRLTPAGSPDRVPWVAVALLGTLLALNFAGIRSGARTQNVLSVAKIAMILGLGIAAFALGSHAGGDTSPRLPASPPAWRATQHSFLGALIAVFYTYGGYQCAMNLAGDVRDAPRQLPRAVLSGMMIVTLLYLGINAAYLHVLGIEGAAAEKLVAAGLARACFGGAGEAVVSAAIFLSAAGFVNATILQVPRSYLAMAQDGLLPRVFLRVRAGTQVQDVGLAVFGATALLAVPFLGSFEKLVSYVIFTDSLMVAVVASCIFVLRRRGAGGTTTFRMPGYPLLPALFVAFTLGLVVHVLWTQPRLALAGAAVFAAGLPLYLLMRRNTRR